MPDAMMALLDNHPMMVAWNKWCTTDEFKNALYWAQTDIYPDGRKIGALSREQYVKGALWSAFIKGWER